MNERDQPLSCANSHLEGEGDGSKLLALVAHKRVPLVHRIMAQFAHQFTFIFPDIWILARAQMLAAKRFRSPARRAFG